MKNEAEIIWWKTVKQDVETTPRRFTGAVLARVAPPPVPSNLHDKNIFKRVPSSPPPPPPSLPAIIILR
ncbi:hypothetical protein WH47_03732 [Habropoda laboriosa]|uniref:Uncharacterized protein n=1 Tax=Habropoda laboriosa TaxID=597456 RepID=A0A0L7QVU6_9HYME|nr:hypothetical protein WH47_03732 [Habropoda laboriosa]